MIDGQKHQTMERGDQFSFPYLLYFNFLNSTSCGCFYLVFSLSETSYLDSVTSNVTSTFGCVCVCACAVVCVYVSVSVCLYTPYFTSVTAIKLLIPQHTQPANQKLLVSTP